MYLKQGKRKDGRIYLVLAKSVRDPVKKVSRTVTVESLGYLDELEKKHSDPIAFYTAEALRRTAEEALGTKPVLLKINPKETLTLVSGQRKNLGFAVISRIFHQLDLDSFFLNKQRYAGFEFNALSITKLLIYSRLLWPCSKKKTWENRNAFFEDFKFSIDDVYRCLSFLGELKEELALFLHQQVEKQYGRKTDIVYYDVTNYYFETDKQDDLKKKGYSKEGRRSPIVQMGLFMDTDGIPITYQLFPGNTVDCKTAIPLLSQVQRQYDMGRVVVVADRGVISGDVIYYALSAKNGYVFSYSIRGADAAFQAYVLDQNGYVDAEGKPVPLAVDDDGNNARSVFKMKSRLSPREIHVTTIDGKKKKRTVHEKHVVFYSDKYAERARKERALAIAKARDLMATPSKFDQSTAHGAAKYVKNLKFDKQTGEVFHDAGKILLLDEDKIKQEERFDGYYALVTSEYKLSDQKIVDIYRGLWQIEETFRISKGELETRPVYLSREDRIQAHFLTCFVALVIGRILEKSLEDKYSMGAILESLSKASGSLVEQNTYVFDYLDELLLAIGAKYDVDFTLKYRRLGDLKKILGHTKK